MLFSLFHSERSLVGRFMFVFVSLYCDNKLIVLKFFDILNIKMFLYTYLRKSFV